MCDYRSQKKFSRNLQTRAEGRNKEFSLSIQKIKEGERSRKGIQSTFTTHLTLSKLEKLVRKKRKAQEQIHEDTLLTSPTSLSMKNSFLIKTAGKAFDHYAQYYKNKKKQQSFSNQNLAEASPVYEKKTGKIEGIIPVEINDLRSNKKKLLTISDSK